MVTYSHQFRRLARNPIYLELRERHLKGVSPLMVSYVPSLDPSFLRLPFMFQPFPARHLRRRSLRGYQL